MKNYRACPERLDQSVAHWVEAGALFHIASDSIGRKPKQRSTDPPFAQAMLGSANFFEPESVGTSRSFS